MTVDYQQVEQLAIISLANPPVNGLSAVTRAALANALEKAQQTESVRYIVLQGLGRGFCGGADIREFNTEAAFASPSLAFLIALIEDSDKVHIALLHGMALGGGLELALACHYRLAHKATLLGLPEVKLGLIPGAGGTQRLPRLIDYELALYLVMSGELRSALEHKASGLVDALFDESEPTQFLQHWLKQNQPTVEARRTRLAPICEQAAAGLTPPERNALAALLIHPALAPKSAAMAMMYGRTHGIDAGLKKERELFQSLLQSEQSKCMRNLFFQERELVKLTQDLQVFKERLSAVCRSWLQNSLPAIASVYALQYSLARQGYSLSAFFKAPDVVKLSSLPGEMDLADQLVQQLDQQILTCCTELATSATTLSQAQIDSLAVQICGWPRQRGGPFYYAAQSQANQNDELPDNIAGLG